MKYTVKCIYEKGVRLKDTEIANAISYTGRVSIEEMPLNVPLASYARKARLLDLSRLPACYDVIPPLFKAEILQSKTGHMMVNGFQIHINEKTGTIQQYIQCWLLCSTAKKRFA